MDETWEYIIGILVTIVFYVIPWLAKQAQKKSLPPVVEEWSSEESAESEEDWSSAESAESEEDWSSAESAEPEDQLSIYPAGSPEIAKMAVAQGLPQEDPFASERAQFQQRLTQLITVAGVVSRDARQQRATVPFAETIDEYVIQRANGLRAELARLPGYISPALYESADGLDLVMAQLEVFIGQRRNPALLPLVGDADALALHCYRPALEFADSRGLQLSSARPVSQVGGEYDLSIWIGFIPTGLAPIFLPADFFNDIMLWPAIAHEIGHDFLAATLDADPGLRRQLHLYPAEIGVRPLDFSGGVTQDELRRIFGGWFEEIFCDLFGTLMLGPAYGYSMAELFADAQNPAQIVLINRDDTGYQYDIHPPRHLRLLLCVRALELMGQGEDAAKIRTLWSELHGGELPEVYLFPHGNQYMALPHEPIFAIAEELVRRLYEEQLLAFSGFRLQDIPGMDFGPAEKARVKQVQEQLLAGQVPSTSHARAIIAGGVYASRVDPNRRGEFLALVRRAIPAVGTAEHAADAYEAAARGASHQGLLEGRPADLRQAFLLHTLLARPQIRWRGGLPWRKGFLQRRVG